MSSETLSIGGFFLTTAVVVVVAMESGYRLGHLARRHSAVNTEKESPVSILVTANMGLLAFVLAFTFGIVSSLYDTRKTLVREDANALRTAFLRSDFLPQPQRDKAQALLTEYIDLRLAMTHKPEAERIRRGLARTVQIQHQLWLIATTEARRSHSDPLVAGLYVPAVNALIGTHALRVNVIFSTKLPESIWVVLYSLLALTMLGFGYQMAIAGSRRSWATPCLALSFALVLALIASLNRPISSYLSISQQPLKDLQAEIADFQENARRSAKKTDDQAGNGQHSDVPSPQ